MADVPTDLNGFGQQSREFAQSVVEYTKALRFVGPTIPIKVRQILLAHYYAGAEGLSVAEMGAVVAYKSKTAASLPYGTFAKSLAQAMGRTKEPEADHLSILGYLHPEKNILGHWVWVMWEDVAAALEDLEWVDPHIASDGGAPHGVAEGATRQAFQSVRVGQETFRDCVIGYWGTCSVTGCDSQQALIAGHIVPWAQASAVEKTDVFNGLLLTPNLDKLFDQHLISFEASGMIRISSSLSEQSLKALGIRPDMRLRKVAPEHVAYLSRHMERFNTQENVS